METILKIENLRTWFRTSGGIAKAVDGVSFSMQQGRTLCVVGESGCGKSVTALSIMQLLDSNAYHASGKIFFGEQELLAMPKEEFQNFRGNQLAMIFQEPMTSLNPVLSVEYQLLESLKLEGQPTYTEKRKILMDHLSAVQIADADKILQRYPHQLSGGMKQRIMIAMAMNARPRLLIADEPTTALDVTTQAQVISLIKQLQKQTDMAALFITHDLALVRQIADEVAVMYAGRIVESGSVEEILNNPQHPYTRKLLKSLPSLQQKNQPLETISGRVPTATQYPAGCRFSPRCDFKKDRCLTEDPTLEKVLSQSSGNHHVSCHFYNHLQPSTANLPQTLPAEIFSSAKVTKLLQLEDLKVYFPLRKGLFKRHYGDVKAVDGVTLELASHETLALVGESGCGKTTLGRAILQLVESNPGSILFNGARITRENMKDFRKNIQVVFQDPYGSLNPRQKVAEILIEAMKANGQGKHRQDRRNLAIDLLDKVGLNRDSLDKYPHEFSGGQRQRIGIARALSVNPKILICDEATSALDVSVQAQILNLLRNLQKEMGLSYLFITHNIGVVEYLADRVAIMYLGRIVESGTMADVIKNPRHPYTKALLASVPRLQNKNLIENFEPLTGEVPSPISPPGGCHFHPRCPIARQENKENCRSSYPELFSVTDTHQARCFYI